MTSGNIERAFGEWLAARGLGSWSPKAVYRASDAWPVFVGAFPASEKLGNALLLNAYADDREDTSRGDDTSPNVYIQVRVRGDRNPFTAEDKAEELFNALHNQTNFTLGSGTQVLACRRVVKAPREDDSSGCWHNIDSYRFTLNPESEAPSSSVRNVL